MTSSTESDDKLTAQFMRKPRSQSLRVPKKISASSSGPVSSDVEDDFMTLPILNVHPLHQASIYESFQPYQPMEFQRQVGCSVTETSHEAQK